MQLSQEIDPEDSGYLLHLKEFPSAPSLQQKQSKKVVNKNDFIKNLQILKENVFKQGTQFQDQEDQKLQNIEGQENLQSNKEQVNKSATQGQDAEQQKPFDLSQGLAQVQQKIQQIQQINIVDNDTSKNKKAALVVFQPLFNKIQTLKSNLLKYSSQLKDIFKTQQQIDQLRLLLEETHISIVAYFNSNCCTRGKNFRRVAEAQKKLDLQNENLELQGKTNLNESQQKQNTQFPLKENNQNSN